MDDHVEPETAVSNLKGYYGESDNTDSRPMNIRRQRRFEKTFPNQGSLSDNSLKRFLYVLKSVNFSEYTKFDFQVIFDHAKDFRYILCRHLL